MELPYKPIKNKLFDNKHGGYCASGYVLCRVFGRKNIEHQESGDYVLLDHDYPGKIITSFCNDLVEAADTNDTGAYKKAFKMAYKILKRHTDDLTMVLDSHKVHKTLKKMEEVINGK